MVTKNENIGLSAGDIRDRLGKGLESDPASNSELGSYQQNHFSNQVISGKGGFRLYSK